MLTCQICGYTHTTMISSSHLKKHGITAFEYKQKYPGAVLRIQSELSKQKIAASKANTVPWNKGKIAGPNEALSKAKVGKPNLKLRGQKRTEEQRARISAATKQAMSYVMTADVKKKLSDSILRKKQSGEYSPPMLGKSLSIESREKIRKSLKNTLALKSQSTIEKFINIAKKDGLVVEKVENNYWFYFYCTQCNSKFTASRQVFRDSTRGGKYLCPICNPRISGRSLVEEDFYQEIKKVWPTAIANNRTELHGKEIDVFIPELRIGFEFAGLYWHSELNSEKPNHLLWKHQYAFKNGIMLYTIFEDEWKNKDLVMSRIKSILGILDKKIFARKCKINTIDSKTRNKFLIENHSQGRDTASINLGLFYNDELVSVATFKKTNMVKGGIGKEWELSRLCSKKNVTVVGGASKLISYFNAHFNTERLNLISYADRRWSDGGLYKSIGFTFVNTTPPSYWYLPNYNTRVHRSTYMKHRLVKNESDKLFTEWELAKRAGLDRIWDCGTTKWIFNFSNK